MPKKHVSDPLFRSSRFCLPMQSGWPFVIRCIAVNQVQQRQGKGKTAMENVGKVREQARRPRADGNSGVTMKEQQLKKSAKGDSTSNRQEIGPIDRYMAFEAPSNRARVKEVEKKKNEVQGRIISPANPR